MLAWSVVGASGAAAPLTGGSSTVVGYIVWGATIASTVQCANSIVRSIDVVRTGGEWIEWLDSEEWYVWVSKLADGFSVAGAGLSAAGTARAVVAIRAATGRSWKEVLKGLNRAERKRLTKELIRMQNKNGSNSQIKTLIRAGTFPSRFTAEQVSTALFRQLRDAISATLAFTGSALSGNIKALYVSIYQE